MRLALCSAVLLILAFPAVAQKVAVTSQELDISFDLETHQIRGTATLNLGYTGSSGGSFTLQIRLHPDLEIEWIRSGGKAVRNITEKVEGDWKVVEIPIPDASVSRLVIRYAGPIYDAVRKAEGLSFVIGDDTRGVIGEEGIFLVASSGWYPRTEGVVTFSRVSIDVPAVFRAVTQGGLEKREVGDERERTTWTSDIPVDGLAMQAGRYVVDTREVDGVAISTYLLEKDRRHAPFLLDQVEKYLRFYTELLGPYPWPKFDIVSNFFTTGYGMPSYTLLGRDVIEVMIRMAPRYGGDLPPGFVDHELVHCWWGNHVYPDYAKGNWCEGLTTYCANYLRKEVRGAALAKAYRKKICQNFSIRVRPENDYPVRRFRGKTEDFENDIGYGKCAMLFHMLRRSFPAPDIGGWDPAAPLRAEGFFLALERFAREYGGRQASWDDIRRVFEGVVEEDLGWFFDQWLDRKGAPDLRLGEVTVEDAPGRGFLVRGEILQAGEPWRLSVPVVVGADSGAEVRAVIESFGASTPFEILSPRPPATVSLDPDFDVFRRIPLTEIQPCLNLTLEREDKVLVVPEGESPYGRIAAMVKAGKGGEIVTASEELPARDCVLFGRPEENPAVAAALAFAGVKVEGNAVTVRGEKYEGEDLWLLLSLRHPEAEGKFVTVFFGMTPKALARARVIFHFGWDGYLVYAGRRPLARGDFTEIRPRTVRRLAPLTPAERIREDLDRLTNPDLLGRLAGTEGDAKTREYLKGRLAEAGVEEIREEPFEFTVLDFTDPDAWTVLQGRLADGLPRWRTSYPNAVVPAVFSPEARDGVRIRRIVGRGGKVDGETLLLLPTVESPEELLEALGPPEPGAPIPAAIAFPLESLSGRGMDGLAAFPSRPPERLEDRDDLWLACGARQAIAPVAPPWLRCPVVFIDPRLLRPGGEGEANAVLRVRFETRTVKSANLRGTIPARDGRISGPRPALSAHFDGLGEGHQGADDNASGVAAVLEAARLLAGGTEAPPAPVEVILFGAEEWGLRGSAALARSIAGDLTALVNLDTLGAADAAEVYLIGRSRHPKLAETAAARLEAEGFAIGRDIDRFAFRHGSDHWPFHEAGVPALDLFSSVHRRMNTTEDVLSKVDAPKVSRIASAVAALLADLSAEVPPAPPREAGRAKATVFPGEEKHLRNLRRLTDGGENAEAYFDPADRLLCFQSKRKGLKADQIFVMGLDGSGQRMISNGRGATTCSFLFPGATRLIYATTIFHGEEPPAPPERSKGYVWKLHPEFEVVSQEIDGRGLVRLTDSWGYDAECALSPDGKWIVFTSCRDEGDPEIYKMRTDGSEVTRLTDAEGYDGGPFFSPDGTKIVWRANRPRTPEEREQYRVLKEEGNVSPVRLEIFVMDADGTNARQVTDLGAASFAPYMHPDGRRIVFCSNLGWKPGRGRPNFDLFLVNIDGTGLERITHGPDFDGFPMFSFDGKRLVFCSSRDNGGTRGTNIFLADWMD